VIAFLRIAAGVYRRVETQACGGRVMAGGATRTPIVIIGAGFGGLGLAIRLKQCGLNDFVILERSDSVGGVWSKNCYPGAACDVPAHLYSFSFEPRADWPEKYASQAEILNYLNSCAQKYELEQHIRFGAEVIDARWDETSSRWIVRTRDDQVFESQSLISATGQLSRPFYPQLPGLMDFSGLVFHSAEWQPEFDLRGMRVAVVGTGASAIQLVPAIAPIVSKLYVFQRSAPYVLPKPDKTYSRWQLYLFKHLPGALRLSRMLTYIAHERTAFAFITWRAVLRVKRRAFFRHLRRGIENPDLRRRLVPSYRLGCKRILLSNDFYPAMNRANVELVTEDIKQICQNAIVATNAVEQEVDCIILATGFAATDFLVPMTVTGLYGQDLHQSWKNGAEAYLGMTVARFPNFFMLYGPNTNLTHNSDVFMIESQIRYVLACLRRLRSDGVHTIEVKEDVQERFNVRIQRRLKMSIWSKGCTNWYLTASGKNTTNWPGYSFVYMLRTRTPKWGDYAVE
jgi:cation diffusion facilitator CzcD-associated flavoprotein CzcO